MRAVIGAAAVLMIVGALFYVLRRQPVVAPSSNTSAEPPKPSPSEPTRPFVTRAPEPPAPPPVAPPASGKAASPELKAALDAARAAMIAAAARDCRPQSRDAEQHLRFRYQLEVVKGSARASGVEKLDTDVADPQMLDCLLKSLGNARWSYATDLTLTADEDWPLGMIR